MISRPGHLQLRCNNFDNSGRVAIQWEANITNKHRINPISQNQ